MIYYTLIRNKCFDTHHAIKSEKNKTKEMQFMGTWNWDNINHQSKYDLGREILEYRNFLSASRPHHLDVPQPF